MTGERRLSSSSNAASSNSKGSTSTYALHHSSASSSSSSGGGSLKRSKEDKEKKNTSSSSSNEREKLQQQQSSLGSIPKSLNDLKLSSNRSIHPLVLFLTSAAFSLNLAFNYEFTNFLRQWDNTLTHTRPTRPPPIMPTHHRTPTLQTSNHSLSDTHIMLLYFRSKLIIERVLQEPSQHSFSFFLLWNSSETDRFLFIYLSEDKAYRGKILPGNTMKGNGVTYVIDRIIGHGSFGVVFQATTGSSGEVVAIKKVLQDKRFKVSIPPPPQKHFPSFVLAARNLGGNVRISVFFFGGGQATTLSILLPLSNLRSLCHFFKFTTRIASYR